jgi:mannosyltransferase OCH1-like enzyme
MFLRGGNLKIRLLIATSLCISLLYISAFVLRRFEQDELLLHRHFLPLADADALDDINLSSPLASNERIPRIIHQIYKSDTVPEKWSEAYASCAQMHPPPNWTHHLWTDEKGRDFLTNNYSWFVPVYDSYPYDVQRVDALRYFLLYHFGGIYLDLDVGCKKDLSPLLTQHVVFGKTDPYGVSNDVMGAEKEHELFRLITLSLQGRNHYHGTKYPTVMMSTGPMFVTQMLLKFLRSRGRGNFSAASSELRAAILPPELYGMSPTSYFEHYPGSSWHGWDVWVLTQISSHPMLFIASITATITVLCLFFKRRRVMI